jgi:LemA protein
MSHEKEIIDKVTSSREKLVNANSVSEQAVANEELNNTLADLYVVVENYPELKASQNFAVLQQSIIEVEEHLQAARRMYNSNVSIFNQMLVTIPSNIVASMSGLTKKDFFEAEETKRQDVKIEI